MSDSQAREIPKIGQRWRLAGGIVARIDDFDGREVTVRLPVGTQQTIALETFQMFWNLMEEGDPL